MANSTMAWPRSGRRPASSGRTGGFVARGEDLSSIELERFRSASVGGQRTDDANGAGGTEIGRWGRSAWDRWSAGDWAATGEGIAASLESRHPCPTSRSTPRTSPRAISRPRSPRWSTASSRGLKHQVLLGATGTGKTFTAAKVIEAVQKPTLVMAHNKTLAAQLYQEFKEFFPDNAVEYFVSYYDYFQPEAYLPRSDTYIEKDSSRNDEIDRLRHNATRALFERRDVVIVASVSAIYGLGAPVDYGATVISLKTRRPLPARRDPAPPRRPPVPAQRRRPGTGEVPGARRRAGGPAAARRVRRARRLLRRRGRADRRDRRAHRARCWRSAPR